MIIHRYGFRFTEEASDVLDEMTELHTQGAAQGMTDEELAAATRAYLDYVVKKTPTVLH